MAKFKIVHNPYMKLQYVFYAGFILAMLVFIVPEHMGEVILYPAVILMVLSTLVFVVGRKKVTGHIEFNDEGLVISKNGFYKSIRNRDVERVACKIHGYEGQRDQTNLLSLFPDSGKRNELWLTIKGTRTKLFIYLSSNEELHMFKKVCEEWK